MKAPNQEIRKFKPCLKMLSDRQTDLPTNRQMDMSSHLEVPLLIAKSLATAESTLAPKGRQSQCTLPRNLSRSSFETLYQQKIYIIELLRGLVNFQNRSSMDQASLIFRSDTWMHCRLLYTICHVSSLLELSFRKESTDGKHIFFVPSDIKCLNCL